MTETPAREWLAASPLPTLDGAEGDAERLVALVHLGVDFGVWGGSRRGRYWDALAERVRAATYAGPTLNDWWGSITADIVSSPRNAGERAETAELLAAPEGRATLRALRAHAPALVLRVRVASETRKAQRAEGEPQ
jgi:hypothetical protein